MRFYLEYLAKIKEPEQDDLIPQRSEIGTLVHNAVQELYRQYPSPLDIPDDIPFPVTAKPSPLVDATIQTFISNIVKTDKRLAKDHELRILKTEEDAYMTVAVPGYGNVRVGGRIDRIDTLDGVTRIIDYKTGSDKPDYDFQLNIYREAYLENQKSKIENQKSASIDAVLYLCKTNEQRTVSYDANLMQDQLVPLLREVLDFISNPPEDPLTILAAKKSTCDNCPYKLLCGK